MVADLRKKKELNPKLKVPSLPEMIRLVIKRDEWRSRSPFQKWCWFYGIGRICIKPVGVPIFEEHHNIAWRAYFLVSCMLVYMIMSMYTTYYYIRKGDFSKALPPTCLLGVTVCVSFLSTSDKTPSLLSSLNLTIF